MNIGMLIKRSIMIATGSLALSLALLPAVQAVEIAGIKMDDTAKVANTELKLNGAGIRYKAVFKVYVAGLYLTEKKNNLADILALNGPKQIRMVMLRDVSADQMGQSFMDGLNHNSTKAEKTKIVNQMQKFGEMFASIPELRKGDIVSVEWVPNVGSITTLNGKRTADVFPDVAFFNALMRIWLGEQPAYAPLKNQMLGLGDKPAATAPAKEN
jgi:hypothetical protein